MQRKLPGCRHYVVTTFFRPPLRKPRTTLVPSLLRPEILAAAPEPGEHLLVYQTAEGNEALPGGARRVGPPVPRLRLAPRPRGGRREGNLLYRPFSEAGFIDDLRTARGVLAGGGFTLMCEASTSACRCSRSRSAASSSRC